MSSHWTVLQWKMRFRKEMEKCRGQTIILKECQGLDIENKACSVRLQYLFMSNVIIRISERFSIFSECEPVISKYICQSQPY